MAEGARVGKLYVSLGADTTPLKTGLNDASGMATGASSPSGVFGKLNLGSIAATAALGAVAVAVGGIGTAAVNLAGQWDRSMATIQSGTGATGEKLDSLGDSLLTISSNSSSTRESLASTLATINTLLGSTGPQLEHIVGKFDQLNQVLGEDAAGNAEKFGQALNSFGLGADSASGSMDGLLAVSQASNMTLGGLLGQLTSYGPVLNNLGLSLGQSADLFGRFNAAGINFSRVSPGINALMRKMSQEGVTDLAGGLQDAIVQLRDATTESEALNIATSLFGAEGAQRMVTAVRDAGVDLDNLGDSFSNATGLVSQMHGETETLGEKWDKFTNKLGNIFIPAIDLLSEAVGWSIDKAIGLFDAWTDFNDKLGSWGRKINDWVEDVTGISTGFGSAKEEIKEAKDETVTFTSKVRTAEQPTKNFADKVKTLHDNSKAAAETGLRPMSKAVSDLQEKIAGQRSAYQATVNLDKAIDDLKSAADAATPSAKGLGDKVAVIGSNMGTTDLAVDAMVTGLNEDLTPAWDAVSASINATSTLELPGFVSATQEELPKASTAFGTFKTDATNAISGITSAGIDSLFGETDNSFLGKIKSTASQLLKGLVDGFITPMTSSLTGMLNPGGIVSKFLGSDGLGGITTGITALVGGGGGATGLLGGLSGALGGVLGSLGSIVSSLGAMAGGLITGFMLEGDLGKIEVNTREAKTQLIEGIQPSLNQWLPYLKGIQDQFTSHDGPLSKLYNISDRANDIHGNVALIRSDLSNMGRNGGAGQSIHIENLYVSGVRDTRQFLDELRRRVAEQGSIV